MCQPIPILGGAALAALFAASTKFTLGWLPPVWCLLLAMVFRGVNLAAHLLEDPFAAHAGGLPIDAVVRAVEVEHRAGLGDADLPQVPRSVARFLL